MKDNHVIGKRCRREGKMKGNKRHAIVGRGNKRNKEKESKKKKRGEKRRMAVIGKRREEVLYEME